MTIEMKDAAYTALVDLYNLHTAQEWDDGYTKGLEMGAASVDITSDNEEVIKTAVDAAIIIAEADGYTQALTDAKAAYAALSDATDDTTYITTVEEIVSKAFQEGIESVNVGVGSEGWDKGYAAGAANVLSKVNAAFGSEFTAHAGLENDITQSIIALKAEASAKTINVVVKSINAYSDFFGFEEQTDVGTGVFVALFAAHAKGKAEAADKIAELETTITDLNDQIAASENMLNDLAIDEITKANIAGYELGFSEGIESQEEYISSVEDELDAAEELNATYVDDIANLNKQLKNAKKNLLAAGQAQIDAISAAQSASWDEGYAAGQMKYNSLIEYANDAEWNGEDHVFHAIETVDSTVDSIFNYGYAAGAAAASVNALDIYDFATGTIDTTGDFVIDYMLTLIVDDSTAAGYNSAQMDALKGVQEYNKIHGNILTIDYENWEFSVSNSGNGDADSAFDNHDAISVKSDNTDGHGQNTSDGYYFGDYSETNSLQITYVDVEIGGSTYTHTVSTAANWDITEVNAIGSFINTTLRDIVDDVAEISYKDGYDDGYDDGYADGFADGVASVTE